MTEAQIQAEIMLALGSAPGVRLFRNSVGEGWVGDVVQRTSDRLILRHARRVTFGWMPGSGDLLGWRSRVITEADVGTTIAQFVSLEVKGRRTPIEDAQHRWAEVTSHAGAAAGIVRSVEAARAVLGLVSA